jgi:hypothetical protein
MINQKYKKYLLISLAIHLIIVIPKFTKRTNLLKLQKLAQEAVYIEQTGLPNILKKDIGETNEKQPDMIYPIFSKLNAIRKKTIEDIRESLNKKRYLSRLKSIKEVTIPNETKRVDAGLVNRYISDLQGLIKSNWKVPYWLSTTGLNTVIILNLESNGYIKSIDLQKLSGNQEFDRLAIESIKQSAPFPDVPIDLQNEIKKGIVVSFP